MAKGEPVIGKAAIKQMFEDEFAAVDMVCIPENIQIRCNELINKHPEQISLFENYIEVQVHEYGALENEMIGSVMV